MSDIQRVEKVKNALLAMQRYQWEQGVAAQAMLEWGEKELTILMAKDAVVRQAQDGRLGVMGDNVTVTDPAANGEAVLYAAQVTGDLIFKNGAEKMLLYLLEEAPRNKEGILYHLTTKNQFWVDSLYMAPPFLAVSGYIDEAIKQIEGYRKFLWDSDNKLYSHIWDDNKQDFERKDFWGVGNGWAVAGITRVIKAIPNSLLEEKKRLAGYVKDTIDGCLTYMRHDGLFHDVVDEPSTFVETNLAQMLSYSIYRGLKQGWLENKYLKYAEKMRKAVYQKVDKFGLVHGVCAAPTFDYSGTAPEGNAFFIMMEAAARDFKSL